MKEYYKILELEKGASEDDIKRSYRKLALKHHPDKGGNSDRFKEITEAYEVLSDSDKKRRYDSGEMDNPFFNQNHHQNPFNDNIFQHFFGNMNMNVNRTVKRQNHVHQIRIKLNDVYTGLQKTLKVNIKYFCFSCKRSCMNCGGKGHTVVQHGPFQLQQTCHNCRGSGMLVSGNSECIKCKGKGEYYEEKFCRIDIPKGIISGNSIVMEGLGEQAHKESEIAGDLLFQIIVEDDINFRREGNNLLYNVKITFKESIIGKEIVIPHFGGDISLEISGFGIINPMKKYYLKNKGILDGDLVITFDIIYPDGKMDEYRLQKFKEIDF